MVDAPVKSISESVQMYLVKIKRLEDEMNPVPLSYLADSLSISPVSVNEMCRKMQEQNLIDYQPYKGASLTPEGDREALLILRRHRLWEVFLVDHLKFSISQAHEMADALEHATSQELADRLDSFLGNPAVSPEGKDIPAGDGELLQIASYPLFSLTVGQAGYCLLDGVNEGVRDYLAQVGLHQGQEITLVGKTDGLVLLQTGQVHLSLSRQIAETIRVIKQKTSNPNGNGGQIIEERSSIEKEIDVSEQNKLTAISHISLEKLKIGQRGTVVSISGKGPIKQRMMDMGLVPGSQVEVVRVAPLGDPMEIRLKGYNLSVRRNEAKSILIEINTEDE